MKPFDLEKALAGEPVVTRDGRQVTDIAKFNTSDGISLAAVAGGFLYSWYHDGLYSRSGGGSSNDLFMAERPKVKKEGWVNIYNDRFENYITGVIFPNEEKAKEMLRINQRGDSMGTTIKIEWEEEA